MKVSKIIRLSAEEKTLLSKASPELLSFFVDIKDHKEFHRLLKFVNFLIDYEKNIFFGSRDYNKESLNIDHAYARGSIASILRLTRMIQASREELESRKKED